MYIYIYIYIDVYIYIYIYIYIYSLRALVHAAHVSLRDFVSYPNCMNFLYMYGIVCVCMQRRVYVSVVKGYVCMYVCI